MIWAVPVELIKPHLAPGMRDALVDRREALGDEVAGTAVVELIHGRFFATVAYLRGNPRFTRAALDLWAWENKELTDVHPTKAG